MSVNKGAERGLLYGDNNLFLNMGSSQMDLCIWEEPTRMYMPEYACPIFLSHTHTGWGIRRHQISSIPAKEFIPKETNPENYWFKDIRHSKQEDKTKIYMFNLEILILFHTLSILACIIKKLKEASHIELTQPEEKMYSLSLLVNRQKDKYLYQKGSSTQVIGVWKSAKFCQEDYMS